MSRTNNRQSRRKPVREAYAQAVEQASDRKAARWLTANPPRVVLPFDSGGAWKDPHDYRRTWNVEFEMTPHPRGPIHEVPILSPHPYQDEARNGHYRSIRMRPIAWELNEGATCLRWWNWEPVGFETINGQEPPQADIYYCVSKAISFMERLSDVIQEFGRADRFYGRMGIPGHILVEWWQETIDALSAWRGAVTTRYVLPNDKGQPVEHRRTR